MSKPYSNYICNYRVTSGRSVETSLKACFFFFFERELLMCLPSKNSGCMSGKAAISPAAAVSHIQGVA